MLWVAFSRRMCCSRVWSVSTKPRRPSASTVSPAIRPGILRMWLSRGREEAERRAAEVEPVAERLALAHADVHAEAAGRLEDAERQRVGRADDERAGALAGLDERAEVLDRAEEVRLLDEDGRRVVVDRRGERVEVGGAGLVERRLDDLAAEARRRRSRSVSRECGCTPREMTNLRRARSRASPGSRPRRPTTAPRTSTRSTPAARSAPRSPSGTRTSPAARPARSPAGTACTASGTPSA